VTRRVVDASVAMKWIVNEPGSAAALRLRREHRLLAPDLIFAECANVLWRKVRRDEITPAALEIGARLLQKADLELHSSRPLLTTAAAMAGELDHPAYDCFYLALALSYDCAFVTADARFVQLLTRRAGNWRRHVELLGG
jgi:predicted nucleic acid-binding protein